MTVPSSGQRSKPRIALLSAIAVVFLAAAVAGAYLDWLWWPVAYGGGLLLALAAGVILLAGGALALVGRGVVRRVALVVLAMGVGLVAGQNLGPSREPLIDEGSGTMTLTLETPVVATATGTAGCRNVASGTEFSVNGDPNMRLDTPDQPFVSVSLDIGNRWEVLREVPRKNGLRLTIDVTAALVTDAGKPTTVGMQATASSTVESTISNTSGSIRFSGLAPRTGPDFSGDSMDLAGTIVWTC
jgi:hypothetical protein